MQNQRRTATSSVTKDCPPQNLQKNMLCHRQQNHLLHDLKTTEVHRWCQVLHIRFPPPSLFPSDLAVCCVDVMCGCALLLQVRERSGERRCWDTLGQSVGGGPIGVYYCHGLGGNQVHTASFLCSILVHSVHSGEMLSSWFTSFHFSSRSIKSHTFHLSLAVRGLSVFV